MVVPTWMRRNPHDSLGVLEDDDPNPPSYFGLPVAVFPTPTVDRQLTTQDAGLDFGRANPV